MIILIVDDNATNRKLLRAKLEAEGHAVLEAVDGIYAMTVLQSEPVDVVISDILMPRMDGYRLCFRIRKHPKFNAIPVILYTSTTESEADRKLARIVGADSYLTKPAPTSVILQAIQQAVLQSRDHNPHINLSTDETQILHKYNDVLVIKLEGKNIELEDALDKIRQAHGEIANLNRDLERRVEQRTAALAAANRELESFSYSVSHDLRGPLRHIDGYVQLLGADSASMLSPTARHHLNVITDASRQMGDLIDDLLEFSRMGQSEMRASRVDLDTLVSEVIGKLEIATTGRNIAWQVPSLPRVVGDASMFRQVFANLLDNAVKFTGPRAAALIEIGCAGEENGRVIVYVRDNGVGFDMQYADKLFGVFQRLHRMDEFEGTGIGLASVQRIIERHGGRVWAQAKPGEGATFYFTLMPAESALQP